MTFSDDTWLLLPECFSRSSTEKVSKSSQSIVVVVVTHCQKTSLCIRSIGKPWYWISSSKFPRKQFIVSLCSRKRKWGERAAWYGFNPLSPNCDFLYFTLSNARRFYLSMGKVWGPIRVKTEHPRYAMSPVRHNFEKEAATNVQSTTTITTSSAQVLKCQWNCQSTSFVFVW